MSSAESVGWAMKKRLDGDGGTGRRPGGPGRPRRVMLHGGHEDVVVAAGILIEIRRLSGYRAGCERCVCSRMRKTLRGRAHDAGEYLIPHAIAPAVDLLFLTSNCC